MNFYHMTDRQVLDMPAKRFWCLEAQIDRVRSEQDLRLVNVHRSVLDKESMEQVVEKLTIDLGETCSVKHSRYVKPDPNTKAKFARLTR